MTDQDTRPAQRPIGEGLFHGMPRAPYFVDETDTQTRFFPRPVTLTLPDHTQRKFPAGVQEVPTQLAGDPWLLKNGMVEYEKRPDKLPPMMLQAPPGSQGYHRAIMEGGVYDATLVPDPRRTDDQLKFAENAVISAEANVDVARQNLDNAVAIANDAKNRHQSMLAERQERDRVDPEEPDDPDDKLTPSQRKAMAKDRTQNEAKLGLDQLSPEDRAKFDALSPKEKATYLAATPEDRAAILANEK